MKHSATTTSRLGWLLKKSRLIREIDGHPAPLSQHGLAALLEVGQQSLSQWENGHSVPRVAPTHPLVWLPVRFGPAYSRVIARDHIM